MLGPATTMSAVLQLGFLRRNHSTETLMVLDINIGYIKVSRGKVGHSCLKHHRLIAFVIKAIPF